MNAHRPFALSPALAFALFQASCAPSRLPPAPEPPAPVVRPAPPPAVAAPAQPTGFAVPGGREMRFDEWVRAYRAMAVARGLNGAWIDSALAGVTPNPRVIALDRAQPDDPTAQALFAPYLARQLTPDRVTRGRAEARAHGVTLAAVERAHGVPAPILLAIWGMETNYGRFMGSFDAIRSIATLAHDGRRAELFGRELDAAIRMLGEGRVTRERFTGSWAGAVGHPQFLPSSYLAFGQDFDGDGRVDLWRSVPDSLASIGRYLEHHGWRRGEPWGLEVRLPSGLDRAALANPERPTSCIRPLERHSRWLTAAEWRRLGLSPAAGARWPEDHVRLTLVQPDGPGTRAFLGTINYRAIMHYNCSNFYALSVGLLADELAR